MGAVSEPLGENCPCYLLGNMNLGVLPGEGEKSWERGWRGMVKKVSLRANTMKRVAVRGIVDRRV